MIVALCKMVEGWGSEIRRSLLHGEGRAGAGPGPGEPLGGSTGCEGGSSGRASAGARRRERERERERETTIVNIEQPAPPATATTGPQSHQPTTNT